jgi:hypothetical protein
MTMPDPLECLTPGEVAELFPELREPPPQIMTGDDLIIEGDASAWAIFSRERDRRYLLGRRWDPDAAWLTVGMLNPSRAGAFRSDPTVTRVCNFAKRDRYGGIIVWNVFSLISTNPHALLRHPDPVGPRNMEAIRAAVRGPMLSRPVVAWGKPTNRTLHKFINAAWSQAGGPRRCWRFGAPTKDGHPRHPLYLPANTPIVRHA